MVVTIQTEAFSSAELENESEKVEYLVVHQNERRIRLLILRLASDKEYTERLKYLIESLDWVTSVRINPAAKSIAVEFDYEIDFAKVATVRQQVFVAIEQALHTEIDHLEKSASVEQDANYWQRLGLPVTALSLALLATPLEVSIPFFVMGTLMAGAALPVVERAIAGIVNEGKCKVDVLDSLWIFLHTLQGQYVAPALMLSLLETGEAVRDITGSINKHERAEILGVQDNQAQISQEPVTNSQVGEYIQEVSESLIVPTLFVSGSIFALTGNVATALAPLQLDFGTGIGIAVPTTILAALSSAADSGILIRNGRALEALSRIDAVIFSNTNTLNHTSALEDLKEQGIKVFLPSELAFPKQEIEIISKLYKEGKTVAYVGDNPTNRLSGVSVSFREEINIEKETGDVVIVGNDLSKLSKAIHIAKQAINSVYQNIAIIALPNISVVIAGVFFGLHPVAAVLINNCAVLIAQMNGEQVLLERKKIDDSSS